MPWQSETSNPGRWCSNCKLYLFSLTILATQLLKASRSTGKQWAPLANISTTSAPTTMWGSSKTTPAWWRQWRSPREPPWASTTSPPSGTFASPSPASAASPNATGWSKASKTWRNNSNSSSTNRETVRPLWSLSISSSKISNDIITSFYPLHYHELTPPLRGFWMRKRDLLPGLGFYCCRGLFNQ